MEELTQPLVEAVPNVSVGADPKAVFELVAAARRAGAEAEAAGGGPGGEAGVARVVDVHLDADHDRSVVTIIGRGAAFEAVLFTLAREAVARVDLGAQSGVHPRVGALDVLPVVALDELAPGAGTVHDAEAALLSVAARIGDELEVPVLRYGRDARGEELAGASFVGALRRGGPAGLAARMAAGEHPVLAGPAAPHPTAGVTAAGLRPVLVALNVDLDVDDLAYAKDVAVRIRERAGGPDALPGVRALGVPLASRGLAQVTMNVEQWRSTSPAKVVERVAAIIAEAGVGVHRVELVGLAPLAATVQLRYACAAIGAPLSCATEPSIEAHLARVAGELLP